MHLFIYRLSNRNNNRIFPSFPVIFVRSHVYSRGWRERSSWNKYSWTHTHVGVKRSASSRLDYEYEKRVERGREEGREWRNPFDRHFHVLHFDSSMSASEIFLHLILRTPCFIPSFNPLARTSVAATKLCVTFESVSQFRTDTSTSFLRDNDAVLSILFAIPSR